LFSDHIERYRPVTVTQRRRDPEVTEMASTAQAGHTTATGTFDIRVSRRHVDLCQVSSALCPANRSS
jgi:hypothetical protein